MAPFDQRQLRFDSLPQAMQEVERLATMDVRTTGNFSFGQILEHLARALDMAAGTAPAPKLPFVMGVFAKLLVKVFKKQFIYGRARPGFKLPSSAQDAFWPKDELAIQAGLEHLRNSVQSFIAMKQFPPHPYFGKLTSEELHQLQCRHFELHLGFVHPSVEDA